MRYKNLVTEEELRALLTPEEIEQVERGQEVDDAEMDATGDAANLRGGAAASDDRSRELAASAISVQRDQQAAEASPKTDASFDKRIQSRDLLPMRVLELEAMVQSLTMRVAILERRLERQSEYERDLRMPGSPPEQSGASPIEVEARIGREPASSKALPASETHKETAAEGEAPLSRLETYSGRKHVKNKKWF